MNEPDPVHEMAAEFTRREVLPHLDARILPIGGGATEVLTDLAARLMGYA